MQKKVFINTFIAISIMMTVLPALATFSSLLTKVLLQLEWYVVLQEYVVPFEARLVAVILKIIGITAAVTPDSSIAMILMKPDNTRLAIELQWNCLGWQSMVLLAITLFVGLKGPYQLSSKIETIVLGVVGTFLINLFRMAFIVALAYYWNDAAALIMHDYFATLVAFVWILFFWWFSYNFLLEEKHVEVKQVSQ